MFMFLRLCLVFFGVEEEFYVQFGISNDSKQIDFESFYFLSFFGYSNKENISALLQT